MKKEIEIIGTGPAGITAAINLVKKGFDVTIFEQHSEAGSRFHGDFQGLENWTSEEDSLTMLKRMGLDTSAFICHPYDELTVFDSNLKKTIFKSNRPFFYLVKRGAVEGSLDKSLVRTAKKLGVNIIYNKKITKIKDNTIVAIGPKTADVIAKGIIFKTNKKNMAAAILDKKLAPGGYAYLLVHEGYATIATCLFKDFKKDKEYLKRTIETFKKLFPDLDITDKKEFGGCGNFYFEKPVHEGGKYFVGESAGLQDCLWGFGMKYAIESGFLAAESISENKSYEDLLENKLLPMQRASLSNRLLYDKLGNIGYKVLIKKLSKDSTVQSLKKHFQPSFLKTMLFPIASRIYKTHLIDKGCHGEDCTCVWCNCGRNADCS